MNGRPFISKKTSTSWHLIHPPSCQPKTFLSPRSLRNNAEQGNILESILDCIPDGLVVADENGKFLWFNAAAERIVGLGSMNASPSEWAQRYGCFRPDKVTPYPSGELPLARAIRGEIVKEELVFIRNLEKPEGVWVTVNAAPFVDEKGAPRGGIVIFRDISIQKEMEETAKQKDAELAGSIAEREQLELFAYVASHDLQEPLQKILAFGDLLAANISAKMDAKDQYYLSRIQNAALRMSRLIEDLVRFSKVATRAASFAQVNLGEVVGDVLGDLEFRIQQSKARIEVHRLPPLCADRMQMQQLFQNFISNAIKFRKENTPPHILISGQSSKDGGYVEVSIEDNGIGFDEKFKEQIFKPFERLHGPGQYEGNGIGLAICQKIVSAHKGKISVQSIPGRGTKFTVTLPFSQDKVQRAEVLR